MKIIDLPVWNPETGNTVSVSLTKEETLLFLSLGMGVLMEQGMMRINEIGEVDLETMEVGGSA